MNSFIRAGRLLSSYLKPSLPSYLIYFVTARCNARCGMCFYWKEIESSAQSSELSPEETEKIAQHLPRLLQLTISGGEPFLREDLFFLLKPLIEKTQPWFLSIPTNGILTKRIGELTEKICSNYSWLRLNLEFSLDGVGELQDQIRGKEGAFQNFLESWRELKELQRGLKNLRLGILSVLSAYNQEQIFDLLKFIRFELKPDRNEVLLVRGEPRDSTAKEVSLKKFKEVSEWLEREARNSKGLKGFLDQLREELAIEKRMMILKTLSRDQMVLPCLAGRKLIVIEPDGWVKPCEMLTGESFASLPDTRLGNLREADYDLNKILKSPQAQTVLRFIKESRCHCSYECAVLANLVFRPREMVWIFWKTGL